MEDSFRVRVDRVFGSLSSSSTATTTASSSSSSSSNPVSSSLWWLTDEEIEKRVWSRDSNYPADGDGEYANYPAAVDGFFANQHAERSRSSRGDREEVENELDDLDDGDDDEEEEEGVGRGGCSSRGRGVEDCDEDEWEVRNSISMDCTLDFEEEEDEYDKVALGVEKSGDRLFMSDVTDYVPHVSSYNKLPRSLKQALRDPRANHSAAKLRLREDSEAAGNFNSLCVWDETVKVPIPTETNAELEDRASGLKFILKRKDIPVDLKSEKRVRFDSSCKTNDKIEPEGDEVCKGIPLNEENKEPCVASSLPKVSSEVPDYIRNPSKYTRYTFDSDSDMNEESYRQAYMDFLHALRRYKSSEPEEAPADLSQRVIFNQKRKEKGKEEIAMEEFVQKKILPVSFADDDAQECEVDRMDEKESEADDVKFCSRKKAARQYRTRTPSE